MTLVELMVAFGLLSLLMGMMFFIYRQGAAAWKKTEAQTQLLQQIQVFTTRLNREAERSSAVSAALDPGPLTGTALSLPSCWDHSTNRYDYSALSRAPVWHQHLIFYFNSATQEVFLREEPVLPPRSGPLPLAGLAAFRSGGKVMARGVSLCNFTLQNGLLEVEFELRMKRYGSEQPEVVRLPTRVYFRN